MAHNPIAANLLMILVMMAGFYSLNDIRKEVFPSFPSETLTISVPYPGSSPEEVEEAVIIKIEEAIQDIPGIEEIHSQAMENRALITVTVFPGIHISDIVNKVKIRVDGISAFPKEVEKPIVEERIRKSRVLNLTLYGPLDEFSLQQMGDTIREELLSNPAITQVTIEGERSYQISIEIPSETLRQYKLSFNQVAKIIQNQSQDLPGGTLRTKNQTISLRASAQAYNRSDFEHIVLIDNFRGSQLTLADIATIEDGFSETPHYAEFNGQPAITLNIDRVGNQSALEIADTVKAYVKKKQATLPESVFITSWSDRTEILKSRISLLLKSAAQGGLLVIITLALFLRPQLAFWVVAGIPFCFLGALALLGTPAIDHSISVISLFGFIMVLGIIVDDAIVTAESAYHRLEKENRGIHSIITGIEEVTMPTIFGIITTMLAFMPMLFVTEGMGRFFSAAVSVVLLCLFFSIIETKFILPAHLAHIRLPDKNSQQAGGWLAAFSRWQQGISNGLSNFAKNTYAPLLKKALKHRYACLAVFIASLIISSQLVPSGLVRFVFFPNIPSDYIKVNFSMPAQTSYHKTYAYAQDIRDAAFEVNEKYKRESHSDIDAIEYLSISSTNDNDVRIIAALIPSTERTITSVEIAKWWREAIGEIPDAKSLTFDANAGHASIPINIRLQSNNLEQLRQVADEAKQALRLYEGVFDIRDSFDAGTPEVNITVSEQGKALGLGQVELARQVRQAFFGVEVQRVQRHRHEVRVYTRLPLAERDTLKRLDALWIRLPNGEDVPFSVVGLISEQKGISKITRINRHRIVNVQADVDKSRFDPSHITDAFVNGPLADILAKYPDVNFHLAGEAEEQAKSKSTILLASAMVLLLMYAALAIPLKSWWQPVIIMAIIPFGLQGALLGHLLLGKEISIISIVGIVALAGIVVNDALVLMDYINHRLRMGDKWRDAVANAGVRRFRAVILTSLTTFLGLLPIQLETSIQAQFLKPMAISVAFGVLVATVVTLILIPILCYVAADIKALFHRQGQSADIEAKAETH
ncbi:MAG: efflux RND transporter permease subunit [Pseudomonadales bacterium]|nr:efflux RND transporter permease subunit [Pseudomonadales bacterium]